MNSPVDLWIRESNKRKALRSKTECYRLVDKLNLPIDIRIDSLGDVLSFHYFSDAVPDDNIFEFIKSFAQHLEKPHWFLRQMVNRGKDPNQKTLWKSPDFPEPWSAIENEITYIFKLNEGTSPGLFLDQRERRNWVKHNSENKTVLNLFGYTGGFSLAAAVGGAKKTITVDVGTKYIEWAKQNFEANALDVEQHEFWVVDAFDFLEGAIKREHTFDLVICDPPSFSRSKTGVFKIERDYKLLLQYCAQVLNKNGQLIFSTNLEEWNQKDFEKKCGELAQELHLKIINYPAPPTDFNNNILKTCLFQKE